MKIEAFLVSSSDGGGWRGKWLAYMPWGVQCQQISRWMVGWVEFRRKTTPPRQLDRFTWNPFWIHGCRAWYMLPTWKKTQKINHSTRQPWILWENTSMSTFEWCFMAYSTGMWSIDLSEHLHWTHSTWQFPYCSANVHAMDWYRQNDRKICKIRYCIKYASILNTVSTNLWL